MICAAVWIKFHHRTPPVPPPVSNSAVVRLLVERDADMLRLRWNPDAPEVRAASRGTLVIDDGAHRSRLPLDSAELLEGTATYRPETQDVRFRLELANGAGGEIQVSTVERPSPFQPEPKPPVIIVDAAPKPHRSGAGSVSETDDEEPRATYTRYWTPATPVRPPETKAPRALAPVVAPAPPPSVSYAERTAATPSRREPARQEASVVPAEAPAEQTPKQSRLGRVVHKIPLLRRIHKDKDKDKEN
jgi:hypothetical protein